MYLISLYTLERHYGGPEEGGWYYDDGDLIATVRTASNEAAAWTIAQRCNGWLDRLQRHCRQPHSILYDNSRINAHVHKRMAPPRLFTKRPSYS